MPTTFDDLPREIRMHIFELVAAAERGPGTRRIVKVFSRNGQIYSKAPPPALLHVCSESRYVTLKWYKPWLPQFKGTSVYAQWEETVERLGEDLSRLQNVYWDFAKDVLLLSGSELPDSLGPLDKELLDSVAFETDWSNVSGFPWGADIDAWWNGQGKVLFIYHWSKCDLPIHPESSMPWTSYKFLPPTPIRFRDAADELLNEASPPSPLYGQVHMRGGAGCSSSAQSSPRSGNRGGPESVYHTPTQNLVHVQLSAELAASTPTPASRSVNVSIGRRNWVDDEVEALPVDHVEDPSRSTPTDAFYGNFSKQSSAKKRKREEQHTDIDTSSLSTPRNPSSSRFSKQTNGKKMERAEMHSDEDTSLNTTPKNGSTNIATSSTQYVVKKFRADRRTPGGLEILVEWEDYPAESDWTWETETSLTESVPDLVEAWRSRAPRKGSVILGEEEEDEEVEILEVEKIMDRRKRRGVPYYLVQWKGYAAEKDRTWEPCEKLRVDVPLLVEEYEEKKELARTRRRRGKLT